MYNNTDFFHINTSFYRQYTDLKYITYIAIEKKSFNSKVSVEITLMFICLSLYIRQHTLTMYLRQ